MNRNQQLARYLERYATQYPGFAATIEPDRDNPLAVVARVAFAILSAKAGFDEAASALHDAHTQGYRPAQGSLARYGMIGLKERAVDLLHDRPASWYLRGPEESWHRYRRRLHRDVLGLGLCKATFAACLLYPTTADVACLDTHIQRWFYPNREGGFRTLGIGETLILEDRLRRAGAPLGLTTFQFQWALWDHVRDDRPNTHRIFPAGT